MKKDEVIDKIREVRHRISAEHGHNPKRLVAHYKKMESKFSDRIVCEDPEDYKV